MEIPQKTNSVVLAILDGVGLAPSGLGNAVARAYTPFLEMAVKNYPHLALEASGEAVGLPSGIMGNSEVGHNAIGSGQIIKHGIAHVDEAFETGNIWQTPVWQTIISKCLAQPVDDQNLATLHFSGIFSDGGVHSHLDHLEKMIKKAATSGVKRIRIHPIFDGRDVAPQSEPKYIKQLEDFAKNLNSDIKIASGGGRMTTTADRYENDWSMVERGFNAMVYGKSQNRFHSAEEAIKTFRAKDSTIQDQYLPDFVVVDQDNQPVGPVKKGDVVVYFDFRADRAVEIATAFTEPNFMHFNRGNFDVNKIYFAGPTEYNSDLHIPVNYLVPPVTIKDTLHEYLGKKNLSQLAVSETAKFGHITYYFDGNSYDKVSGEDFVEISSDKQPFNTRPWMKSAEIADVVIDSVSKYDFIRVNFPGGDMVGHFAELDSTMIALEAIDLELTRIAKKVDEMDGFLVIVADHGNAEELLTEDNQPKTSHSLNKVPCIIYGKHHADYQLLSLENPSLANLAATIATLLNQTDFPSSWHPALIKSVL